MNFKALLIALSVALALTSCGTTERLLNSQGYVKAESITPPVCASGAFVDETKYELFGPASATERDFKLFTAQMATLYPNLKLSYHQLRDCFESVHGKQKNSD